MSFADVYRELLLYVRSSMEESTKVLGANISNRVTELASLIAARSLGLIS